LALQNNVSSWVFSTVGVVSTISNVETPRTDQTFRNGALNASGEIASFDTNGAVSSFAAQNVALGVSAFYMGFKVELVASPRSITALSGSYSLSGADTPIIRPSPISFVGAANGTNTATMPAHVAGDLIIIAAYNNASNSIVGLLSGYTSASAAAAGSRYRRLMWKIATSSGETIPTITNATICAVAVYRNTKQDSPLANVTVNTGVTPTLQYPTIAVREDGSSWVGLVGLVYNSAASSVETPPPNCINRTNGIVGSTEIAVHDTDSGVGIFSFNNIALGASYGWDRFSFEILAPQNVTLTADAGSYTLTGADTNIARSYTLMADPGSYMLSGADTPFIRALFMSAASGAYTITGADTPFDIGLFIIAEPGNYALSGSDTSFVRSLIMSGAAGAYAISGADTSFVRSLIMSGAAGAYTISGADVLWEHGYVIIGTAGAYGLAGADLQFVRTLFSVQDAGSYAISGTDTPIYAARLMTLEAGSYSIDGSPVSFNVNINAILMNYALGGDWLVGKLRMFKDGAWIKPTLKLRRDGNWEEL
jgi:hypothetical protein